MCRELKDSGIPWIGEIPASWGVMPHKRVMHKVKEIKEHYNGENILSLTMRGVIVRDLDAGGKMPTTFDGYQKVYPNNLLQCLFDIDVTPRCVGLIRDEGLTSPAYSQFAMYSNGYAPYYDYLLRYMDDGKTLLHLSKNLRSSLTETDFGAIDTCVPPLAEQQRIAEFLDRKCAEVDEMIALQEQIIEELKAYKQSVITEAVTKGLNPDAPMRDSGIEWIGSIPEHWETAYLKRFCKVNSGREIEIEIEIELEQDSDNAVPVYGSGGVFKYTNKPLFNGEVVMFGRKGTLGKPIYANGRFWAVDTMYYLTFGNSLEARYCFYQLVAFNWEPYITQTALPSIVATDIVNTSFAFPPIAEQQAIADYLDDKCADIDSLIQTKQSKIDSLKEYKKSIIYEYVTGKQEVNE